jgi:hypothetical protein
MKARLLACAAAGLACAFPGLAGAQAPPYAVVASARSVGFEVVSTPMRRGPVYIMLAVNRYGMRVSMTADARSGRILSVTRPYDDPASGARKVAAQPPRAHSGESAGQVTRPVPDAPLAKAAESAPSPSPAKPVMVPIAPLE